MNDWHDAEQRVERAQELFAQQKWQEALEELRAAIAINPYNSAWYFNLGLTLDEMGRFREAVEAYQNALRIEPEDLEALCRLGEDYSRLGRFDESIKALDRIEQLDPSFEPAYCGRILAYTELQDHQKAEELFYLARQYKDECPDCYFQIGRSLAHRGFYEKAIYCWQKTLDLDESYPQVHLFIARALAKKGELGKARLHLVHELRSNPGHIVALLELGDLLLEMQRIEEAGEKFRRAIELAPHEPSAYVSYARWLLACRRVAEARESLHKALSILRQCSGAHLLLARISLLNNDQPTARRHLRAELQHGPRDPRILLELGNRLMDCGQSRPAIVCLQRLIQAEPRNTAAWHDLAVAYFLCNRFPEGIACCREALRLNPREVSTTFNLALTYQRQGRYGRALAWIRRGLCRDPHDGPLQRLEVRIRLMLVVRAVGRFLARFSPRR